MDIVEMNTQQDPQQQQVREQGGRRARRHIAKQMVERGQRMRNRAGLLIGLSLGLVALLSILD